MSKLKMVYILMLAMVAVLLVITFFMPMTRATHEYSEVQRESLIRGDNGWILQFDIMNPEHTDQKYKIDTWIDGQPSTLTVSTPSGRAFTYVKHINPDMLGEGVVRFAVYREGEDTHLKKGTYYLR